MSTINLSNLKIIDRFSEPYPLIIYSDLLDVSQLDSLQESLSKDETIYDRIDSYRDWVKNEKTMAE